MSVVETGKQKMDLSLKVLKGALLKVKTGRAQVAMVEDIMVEAYGTRSPLKQLAAINTPQPNLFIIEVWDESIADSILKAIQEANLGFNPIREKKTIRIPTPPLTEERRNEMAKIIKNKVEETKISLRNIRRELMDELDKSKDDGDISEDDYFRQHKLVDELTSKMSKEAEELGDAKEEEIKTI